TRLSPTLKISAAPYQERRVLTLRSRFAMTNIAASTISRTLRESLAEAPFSGHVVGVFRTVCNLVDAAGRVVVLTSPSIGNGPFSLVLDGDIHAWQDLVLNESVYLNSQYLKIANTLTDIRDIEIWEPQLLCLPDHFSLPTPVIDLLKPYLDWPHLQV